MKWQKINKYFEDNYDWVLIKYYDKRDNFECIPNVAEYNKNDGKWHFNDYNYTIIDDIFEVRYFIDMQKIKD